MRRDAKGARLWLRPERRNGDRITHKSEWVIRDGSKQIGLGLGASSREEAERRLAAYLSEKYTTPTEARSLDAITVADVVAYYLTEIGPKHARPRALAAHMENVIDRLGHLPLASITGKVCRDYVRERGATTAATRELQYLRAAVNVAYKENIVRSKIAVVLPPPSQPRDRWLTRDEAARLLWTAYTKKEIQHGKETARHTCRHVARFILVGLYTGSRAGVICRAGFAAGSGSGHFDLDAGVYYRHPAGRSQSKKRAPPVPLSDRLLAHLRRWQRRGICREAVVERHGRGVASVSKGFRAVAKEAGLDDVHPHVLRHTAATWLMQGGADLWQASGLLGMTVQTLQKVYGHHHPRLQREAAQILASHGRLPQAPTGSTRTKRVNRHETHLKKTGISGG